MDLNVCVKKRETQQSQLPPQETKKEEQIKLKVGQKINY